jgi:hypothetical protein
MTCLLKPMLSKTRSMPTYAFSKKIHDFVVENSDLQLACHLTMYLWLTLDHCFMKGLPSIPIKRPVWHIVVIKVDGAIYKGILEPLPLIYMMVSSSSRLNHFVWCNSLASCHSFTWHLLIPVHDWIQFYYDDIPFLCYWMTTMEYSYQW